MNQNNNDLDVNFEDPKIEGDSQWFMNEQANLLKYCKNKELGADKLLHEKYAGLAPLFALWAVESRREHKKYWVLTGDLPHDHLPYNVAEEPREALRHFSMAWQIKAENLQKKLDNKELSLGSPEQQQKKIALLLDRAEGIYTLAADDTIWQQS